MIATEWDKYFDGICLEVAKKSKDPNTKLGCVIVSKDHSIISTGFNGFCRGVKEDIPERWANRETKYKFVEHAERNAIYNHARHGGAALLNSIAYIPIYPCIECTKGLIQAGIKNIRMNNARIRARDMELTNRLTSFEFQKFMDDTLFCLTMFKESDVEITIYELE